MFQTEIIIFLQSLGSDLITFLLKAITDFGRSSFTIIILIIIMFGVNIKTGFILSWAVIWNGLFTDLFKNIFALPRPANVDSNVLLPGKEYPNPATFKSMGGKSFWGKLPQQAVDHLRVNRIDSWGFPSGHSSNAMTLWGSTFLYFKKKWVRIPAILLIILMPLSRMYLGRHFLADILGGLILGSIITLIFYKFVFKNETLKIFLFEETAKLKIDLRSIMLIVSIFLIPGLLFLIPQINPDILASLLGINLAFFLIRLRGRGFPKDSGTILIRISRIIITAILFFCFRLLLKQLTSIIFTNEILAVESIIKIISISLSLWISTEINLRLGFFKK